MYHIVERIATDNGLTPEQAEHAYSAIVSQLLTDVPELENIIDQVFGGVEPEKLQQEIIKLIHQLQYRGHEYLKHMKIPEQTYFRVPLRNELF